MDTPHNDALVLMVNISNYDVKKVLIGLGSSSEVIYLNLYDKLQPLFLKKTIRSVDMHIYSFSGEPVWLIAIVELPVKIGQVIVIWSSL